MERGRDGERERGREGERGREENGKLTFVPLACKSSLKPRIRGMKPCSLILPSLQRTAGNKERGSESEIRVPLLLPYSADGHHVGSESAGFVGTDDRRTAQCLH